MYCNFDIIISCVVIRAGYYSHISTLADVHEHVQVRVLLRSYIRNAVALGLFYSFYSAICLLTVVKIR